MTLKLISTGGSRGKQLVVWGMLPSSTAFWGRGRSSATSERPWVFLMSSEMLFGNWIMIMRKLLGSSNKWKLKPSSPSQESSIWSTRMNRKVNASNGSTKLRFKDQRKLILCPTWRKKPRRSSTSWNQSTCTTNTSWSYPSMVRRKKSLTISKERKFSQ